MKIATDASGNASANLVLSGFSIASPTEGDGYLIVARDLMPAVDKLAVDKTIPNRAFGMLAAHTLECLLKAHLWHQQPDRQDIGGTHDLIGLWRLCGGVFGTEAAPHWVETLANHHGPNFVYRYQSSKKDANGQRVVFHATVMPAADKVTHGLHEIHSMVVAQIALTRGPAT